MERRPFVVPRLQDELPLDRSVIDELMRLSWWERVTLTVDDGLESIKFYAELSLHIFTIGKGIMFKNWKTTLAGIGALVGVVINAVISGTITPEGIGLALGAIGLIFAKDAGAKVQQ